MAIIPICGKLINGQDTSCKSLVRKYYQQGVVINKDDIDPETVTITTISGESQNCEYSVEFELKPGKKGYRISGEEGGNIFLGRFDKSRNDDTGHTEYQHQVQIFVGGIDEETKCILHSLDHGSYVVALQASDGTVEIFGITNGLSTDDYTWSPAENGGGGVIPLYSSEGAPESLQPLIYKPQAAGDANADFDSEFENEE